MAALQQFLHQSRPPFESPAKIFAKLKSKVQGEFVDDSPDDESRALGTPKRRTAPGGGIQLEMFGNGEVTALTLSPISSPQKTVEDDLKLSFKSRQRPFMESTAVCNTTQQSNVDAFVANARWLADRPVHCAPGGFEEAPGSVFSPVRRRLRKRKVDDQLLNKANNTFPVLHRAHCNEKEMKIRRTLSEDDHDTNTRNADPVALRRAAGCTVDEAPPHPVTPAKIFAFLKERENQKNHCDVHKVTSSTRPDSVEDNQSERRGESDCAVSRVQSPELNENVLREPVSSVPSQPVVLEDPLLLSSPRVSIPKIQRAEFKRNKWSLSSTFPSETVIHLSKWFIRRSRNGLFIDGICRENNIGWNSNIIAERVSRTVLKTVTGRVYVLVGKMVMNALSEFPKWFLKSFANGFPSNWKELFEDYLSEQNGLKRGTTTQSEKRSQKPRTSMEQSQQQQKSSESCHSSSTPSLHVSRSGRLIKPPLDYWRGGRVILDADNNMTIHDGYDSIIQPELPTSITAKSSVFAMPVKKAALVKVPLTDDYEQKEPAPQSQLQRKVRGRPRKPRQTGSNVTEKTPSPVNHIPADRGTRASQKGLAAEKTSQEAKVQESKNTKKKGNKEPKITKAKPVKGGQQPAFSQRSPSVDTSTSSQPLNRRQEKENIFKKTGTKRTGEKSLINLPRRSSRSSCSSRSSHSSQERETHSHKCHEKQSKTSRKRRSKTPSPKPTQIATQTAAQPRRTRKRTRNKHASVLDEDAWTEEELRKLQDAVSCHPQHVTGYWTKVAMMVGTRSADECHKQHACQGASKTPPKRERKTKQKVPLKEKVDNPVISARVGTLRRKQQVRDFLEAMPKDDMDDVFSSAYMQTKRFEMPSMCPSDDNDFSMSNQDPLTPKPTGFPEAKTPQCLHITPGMMGSSSRNYDDKYVYQLQKRMKNQHQFNVQKHAPKNFSPTASVKKAMRRCANTENNTFVVWEMFPDKEAQPDSDEEEDFYFSED